MTAIDRLKKLDWITVGFFAMVLALGWSVLWSASTSSLSPDSFYLKQIIWIALGFGVIFLLCLPHYFLFMRSAYVLYTAMFGMLVLVAVMGKTINQSKRWLDFKLLLFQPSESMKVVFILALARYLMYRDSQRRLWGLLPPFFIAAIPMLMIAKQPDLGTALIFPPVLFSMLYVAGARRLHLGLIALIVAVSMPVGYHTVLKEYQKDRIRAFLNPEAHSDRAGYHVISSKDAIGSGGWTGKGLRQGEQNAYGYVPEKHNDFIFSVIGEEFGFLGSCLLVLIYYAFLLSCLFIGLRTREPWARLTVVGITTLFAFQGFVNIGMTIGLMPVTGLTLPFVSYGGSSVISCFFALGLLMNISMRRTLVLKEKDDFSG